MELKVWKLHPQACRILQAEKTIYGTANPNGVKWCGPYATANSMGWHLFPPADIDIIWKNDKKFEYRHIEEYTDYDYHYVRTLIRRDDHVNPDKWSPPGGRTKYTWGLADTGVVQIWTGLILQTPPGWCLHITNPINCVHQGRLAVRGPAFAVQEAVLETDWMQYDIWINLKFLVKDKWVYLRKNNCPPIAHLIPIPRESLNNWTIKEEIINRKSPESEKVFKYWLDYNQKKYGSGGKQYISANHPELTKDSTTYHREKKKLCPHSGDFPTFNMSQDAAICKLDLAAPEQGQAKDVLNPALTHNCPQDVVKLLDHEPN